MTSRVAASTSTVGNSITSTGPNLDEPYTVTEKRRRRDGTPFYTFRDWHSVLFRGDPHRFTTAGTERWAVSFIGLGVNYREFARRGSFNLRFIVVLAVVLALVFFQKFNIQPSPRQSLSTQHECLTTTHRPFDPLNKYDDLERST